METNFSKKQLEILSLFDIDQKEQAFLRASNILLQVGSEFFKGLNFKMEKWHELCQGSESLKKRLLALETNLHSYFNDINKEVNQQKLQIIEEIKQKTADNKHLQEKLQEKESELKNFEEKYNKYYKKYNEKKKKLKEVEYELKKQKLKYDEIKLDHDTLMLNLEKKSDKESAQNFTFLLSISSFSKPWIFKFEKEKLENKKFIQIALLGEKDVGKSYVLSNILDKKEKNNAFPSTFGKIAGKSVDNTLYLEYSETINSSFDRENCQEVEKLEDFLEDFFLQNSNAFIFVVSRMGRETQNNLKKILSKKKSIKIDQLFIIIHNFQCYSFEEMNKGFKFHMKHFPKRIKKPDDQDHLGYFDDENKIYHFPLGLDFGESKEHNLNVFSYIQTLISETNEEVKVKFMTSMQKFFNKNYGDYLIRNKGEKLEMNYIESKEIFEITPKNP